MPLTHGLCHRKYRPYKGMSHLSCTQEQSPLPVTYEAAVIANDGCLDTYLAAFSMCSLTLGCIQGRASAASAISLSSSFTWATVSARLWEHEHKLLTGYSQPTHRLLTGYSQPTHRLLTAYSQDSHCLLTAYSLPTHRLLTAYSQPTHRILTAYSLPTHRLLTAYSLPTHRLLTAYSQATHSLLT